MLDEWVTCWMSFPVNSHGFSSAVSVSILPYIICLQCNGHYQSPLLWCAVGLEGLFKNNVFAVIFKVMVLGVDSPLCGQSKRRGHMTKMKSGTGILGIFQWEANNPANNNNNKNKNWNTGLVMEEDIQSWQLTWWIYWAIKKIKESWAPVEPPALADNKYHLTTLNYNVVNVIFELALTSHHRDFRRRVVNDDYCNNPWTSPVPVNGQEPGVVY